MISILRRVTSRSISLIVSLVVLAVMISPAIISTPLANAQALAPHRQSDQANAAAVQLASPAVVRIVSIIQAQLICIGCLQGGGNIESPAAGQQPFTYGSAGSGAFITPDGYILTADHVVDHTINNPEDVSFIEQAASQDIAQQYPSNTPDQVLTYLQNNPSQVQINMQVVLQKAFLSTAYTGQLQSTGDVQSFDVTRIATNSAVEQDDTAIIKVEASDMPYLAIAPPNSINVGDQVTAIAYPADADDALRGQNFFALADPSQSDANTLNSLLGASVNSGQVTAKKTLSNGTPVYEASDISSQGSSGGPVIDDQGRIIGFVDAGPSSGTDRLTFLVPSEVISQYVKQSGNSNPTPGQFETLWARANQEQFASGNCHWTKAASDYQKLHDEYPHFAGVDALLANAKNHATPSECPPPTPVGLIAGVGGGVLVLLIVGVLGAVLLTRRRKPAVAAVPAGSYNYQPQLQSPSQPMSYTPPGGPSMPDTPTPAGGSGPGYPGNAPTVVSQGMPPVAPMPAPNAYAPPPSAPVTPMSSPYSAPASAPYAPPATPAYQPPASAPMQPVEPTPPAQPVYQPPVTPTPAPPSPYAPPPTPQPVYQPPVSTPAPQQPVPPAQPMYQPTAATRYCANGHAVTDATAQFCPSCGAPIVR